MHNKEMSGYVVAYCCSRWQNKKKKKKEKNNFGFFMKTPLPPIQKKTAKNRDVT
jgi:hypothetical protein